MVILVLQENRAKTIKGHWGTCPGVSLVYAHLNALMERHDLDVIYLVGPGHGAPAIQACLRLEGSLETFHSDYTRDEQGLCNLIVKFSSSAGFPRSAIPERQVRLPN